MPALAHANPLPVLFLGLYLEVDLELGPLAPQLLLEVDPHFVAVPVST